MKALITSLIVCIVISLVSCAPPRRPQRPKPPKRPFTQLHNPAAASLATAWSDQLNLGQRFI
ncbi:hypothetical protein ABDK00_002015 [Niabella insulamsoli]|uniref:hypothetical protein n=1 Tax=Niabella insulamsoli TaxID=3144874 RepID=UPI0031FBC961